MEKKYLKKVILAKYIKKGIFDRNFGTKKDVFMKGRLIVYEKLEEREMFPLSIFLQIWKWKFNFPNVFVHF